MGMGYLRAEASAAFHALPVAGAGVTIKNEQGQILHRFVTDESGLTPTASLYAPDASHTMTPEDPGPYYAVYDVEVAAPDYETVIVRGVQVFDGETSILPVQMTPLVANSAARALPFREIVIPESDPHRSDPWLQQGSVEAGGMLLRRSVVVPDYLVVHLGSPASSARNVRVSFQDYIKNVASSEIYPTWPDAALEANIYCQISFTLNRVFTEWYPSRGYAFHITSSTSYDQSYVDGRNIFANISVIVDNIFNTYVRRAGHAEPFFTQYCNGTTVTCAGLSQWGTVPLANQGLNAYQILRRYYPADIQLTTTDNIGGITESYPGTPLRQGSQGESVRLMQTFLNRIRVNYPLIPQISNPNGVFGADTTAAVRTFQSIFSLTADGIVGRATWYKIISIYNAVKKLADLESEGERIGIGNTPPTSILREGSRGSDVVQLQFILNMVAEFYSDIPTVLENSQFDTRTKLSVIAFQTRFGLNADGVVGPATWQKLYQVYHAIEEAEGGGSGGSEGPGNPQPPPDPGAPAYPGTLLQVGSRGESVRLMQQYLNAIFGCCPTAPVLSEDGIFGAATQNTVAAFQRMKGLSQDGVIGPLTWNAIVAAYGQG